MSVTSKSTRGNKINQPPGRPKSKPSAPKKRKQTKLAALLLLRGISQSELIATIREKYGKTIGKDRISRIINGMTTDYMVSTATMISGALDVRIEEILEE